MDALSSMNIFLRQEIDRMQRVITAVRNTLMDLKLAIDGTIIMSENLKDALDNIYDARVPALWKKVSLLLGRRNRFRQFDFLGAYFSWKILYYVCKLLRAIWGKHRFLERNVSGKARLLLERGMGPGCSARHNYTSAKFNEN